MRESSENIMRAIDLARQLVYCADLGGLLCEDKQCSLFYSVVRDNAEKIILAAEKERALHVNKGIWDKSGPAGSPVNKGKEQQ